MKNYQVSEQFLHDLIDKGSKSLVGKIMKRFEIFDDKKIIKASIKELVYENYRVLHELIKSFSSGVKFISKPSEQKDSV